MTRTSPAQGTSARCTDGAVRSFRVGGS
jgi:hypothetical protein